MAEKKGGLGKGIGALIPGANLGNDRMERPADGNPISVFFGGSTNSPADLVPVPGATFGYLTIDDIAPNAKQPRTNFDPEDFAELVGSIREFGVLQPISVRSLGKQNGVDKYELIMGERRLRASKEAGLTQIPAVIRETSDNEMLRDALLENLHRSDLNAIEEANAYQQLLEEYGCTQDQLADKLSRSRPQITNTLRLLKLPVSIQTKVAAGVLSAGHARAILSLEDQEQMIALANKVINQGLSVRATEEAAKPVVGKATIRPGKRQESLKVLAEKIGDKLNTSVRIKMGLRKGTIEIDFASIDDMKRILKDLGQDTDF
ncbi:MAG: ParB/RepB/Spo0J family partition protein [Micrococcales bacterium]|nr:ParB/RepB/Spo0J family partition protein [Micrococcales bacterium]NBR54785.1 ParB/RepB/Spo0J family partition protein [Micrococcales bacterium]NBR60962.1 ParB/RepB/Spo0J family partition protein [Actinomycetota bacterium]NBT46766.1 ParB/RepB/Spo0J family partition protein [Actinomycetota bacterium]NBY43670.1 ParB/RepB/Spo0J family partition protein [Micrococcales bacterium]